jgi:hypothetical protein
VTTVCLSAGTLYYPEGGGHRWVYLNWALGLREAGCDVIWQESVDADTSEPEAAHLVASLREHLAPHGLASARALCSFEDGAEGLSFSDAGELSALSLDAATDADLLLNISYSTSESVVRRFRRTALVDIDPGLLQHWMSRGEVSVPPHDMWFTRGETVAARSPTIPDTGHDWQYTPPAVALSAWTRCPAPDDGRYTTVAGWWDDHLFWAGRWQNNSKRVSFLDHLDLPERSPVDLELALDVDVEDDEDVPLLRKHRWSVRAGAEVAGSPAAYQDYIRRSRGEFSCVKPSCAWFSNAWISDRTLCYLATGRPAVVQHTGRSTILPDRSGLLRFRTPDEAVRLLKEAESDYEFHAREARSLAEHCFDARAVVTSVLERALP